MPLEKDSCGECGEVHAVCPECGDKKVTAMERHGYNTADYTVKYEQEGEYEWKHVCWNCGWTEMVTAEITREVTK